MKDFRPLLIESGLKVTKARLGVLEWLHQQKEPSDIVVILDWLTTQQIKADQATVYRIMEKFLEKELVRSVDFEEGKRRFELADDHHHHLVCSSCKKVVPFAECDLNSLDRRIKDQFGFEVNKHNLEFFGTCKNCQ